MTAEQPAPARLSAEQMDRYLDRIGYQGPLEVTDDVLIALHGRHLETVPFENLDVVGGERAAGVDRLTSFDKIVNRGRGGWCFECNGAFSLLLEAIGFGVTLLSARVDLGGELGPNLDHLCLLVDANRSRWLCDVGFGSHAYEPLRFETELEQASVGSRFRLKHVAGGAGAGEFAAFEVERKDRGQSWWQRAYHFSLQPRVIDEFTDRCVFLSTSPESAFTRKPFATRATGPRSRAILRDGVLAMIIDGVRIETRVDDDETFNTLLSEIFKL